MLPGLAGQVAVAVLPVFQEQRCCCACLQPASGSMEGIWLGGTRKWPTLAREESRLCPTAAACLC